MQPFQGVQIGLGDPPRPSAPIDQLRSPPGPRTPATLEVLLRGRDHRPHEHGPDGHRGHPDRREGPGSGRPHGRLSYQPVLAVFHNPPAPTLRVSLGDESIVATGIHRFWKAGHGWAMARDLKAGDTIRTLGGAARVTAVESDETQPVFNLEVAEGGSFFVGQQGALVHDNSRVHPTPEPFDAAPDLAAVAPSASPR